MLSIFKKYISIGVKSKIKAYLPNFTFENNSYSQCGEDIIIAYVLNLLLGSKKIRYLDIGANHPFQLSNTALLYKSGGQGILIEPDPFFADLLRKKRPRDSVMQCGIHFSGEAVADFYVMDTQTLNTFSRIEMERYISLGHHLSATLPIPLKDINSVLEVAGDLDFINLDIEGLDHDVLKMVNWNKFRPTCICVETLTYDTLQEPKKLSETIKLMLSKDYFVYADTFINTIFIDNKRWQHHWQKKKF